MYAGDGMVTSRNATVRHFVLAAWRIRPTLRLHGAKDRRGTEAPAGEAKEGAKGARRGARVGVGGGDGAFPPFFFLVCFDGVLLGKRWDFFFRSATFGFSYFETRDGSFFSSSPSPSSSSSSGSLSLVLLFVSRRMATRGRGRGERGTTPLPSGGTGEESQTR